MLAIFFILCCLLFVPIQAEKEDADMGEKPPQFNERLFDSIRESFNGMELENSRIVWDDRGFRVEPKDWSEKAGEWLRDMLILEEQRQRLRMKRQTPTETTLPTGTMGGFGNAGSEELIRVNANIVFFRNGTRIVDVKNGPLIIVDPYGEMHVEYRNGSAHQPILSADAIANANANANQPQQQQQQEQPTNNMEGQMRAKRFNSLDDLYSAHGFGLDRRDATGFGGGAESIDRQKMKANTAMAQGRADDENGGEEEEEDGTGKSGGSGSRGRVDEEDTGGEWTWVAKPAEHKNSYWDKPLYGAGEAAEQQSGKEGRKGEMLHPPIGSSSAQRQPSIQMMIQPPPKPQKHAQTWEQFGSASSSFQQPENGQKPQQQQQRQPQQPQGSSAGQWQQQQQLSQQLAESASISGSAANPPSLSPSAWLKSRLQSSEPLSEQEIALVKEWLRQEEQQQQQKKKQMNGKAMNEGGKGGGGGGVEGSKVPNWAKPITN